MIPVITKWLDKHALGYEVQTTTEGKEIIFVPSTAADRAQNYFRRFHKHAQLLHLVGDYFRLNPNLQTYEGKDRYESHYFL